MHGAIIPLPQYSFMAWCLVKAQGQVYFTFMEAEGFVSCSQESTTEPCTEPVQYILRLHTISL